MKIFKNEGRESRMKVQQQLTDSDHEVFCLNNPTPL